MALPRRIAPRRGRQLVVGHRLPGLEDPAEQRDHLRPHALDVVDPLTQIFLHWSLTQLGLSLVHPNAAELGVVEGEPDGSGPEERVEHAPRTLGLVV